ncbi:hypothetical protein CMI37_32545 [Candidatus Pacearchaeota archaeon]|nr:hypothetical protein [Candidatus Pacearchaeota archaeon]|tara:strand:+ start:27166 stop:27927 length:762 start_codon:yes stop_codon:yes gene_type:complete
MPISALMVAIIAFLLYLFLSSLNPLFGSVLLLMFFAWAFPNLDEKLAGFYLFLLLISLILGIIMQKYRVTEGKSPSMFGIQFQGFTLIAINLFLGGGLIYFAAILQGRSETAILGVPTLAISGTIATALNPATSGMLGIVENKFLFTIYDFFKYNMPQIVGVIPFINILAPFFILVIPIIIAVLFFALLHLNAYALAAGALFFAGIMMFIWILGYETVGSLMADVFHYWWNSLIRLGTTLRIVGSNGSGLEVL